MKILKPSSLDNLKYVFLDTNIYVAAIADDDFVEFLTTLHQNVVFFTIEQVVFEFTRGSDSLEQYNKRLRFLESLTDTIYPIHKHKDQSREFTVLMQKCRPQGQYTDFMLCLCLYALPDAYLFTGDHSAMPLELFDREYIITTDTTKNIQSLGFYKLNMNKLAAGMKKI